MSEPTTAPASTPAAPPPAASTPAPAEATKAAEPTSALGSVAAAPAADAKPAETKPAEAAPAALELKVPEGFTDTAAVEGIKALAGELGLDSPKAQLVLEKFAGWAQAQAQAAEESFAKQDAEWAAALKADPELGGQKWAAAQKDIGRAVAHFKAQPVMKLLHAAGLGNHPELVRFVARIGQSLREDTVAGTSAAPAPAERLSDAALFYGPTPTSAPKEQ